LSDKILITGGAGFIGSHLTEHCLRLGREVVIVDNLSTGRRGNIEPLLSPRCTLIKGRLSDILEERPHLLEGVAEVYHLAAAVGVKLVVDDPAGMIDNNVRETALLLRAAVRHRAAVLIASSSEVYGKGVAMPLREDQDMLFGPTTASRWSYALTKAIDEHLALAHHRSDGLRTVIVRLFNTIGPRQVGNYGMVVPRFVRAAVDGEDIAIYGNGKQTRAFCDARDVVRAMVQLMSNAANSGQVFNVGSDREITIETLADRVLALTQSRSKKRYVAYEQAYQPGFEDPQRRVPDLGKVRAAIGFEPSFTLDDTLGELIAAARASGSAASAEGKSSP